MSESIHGHRVLEMITAGDLYTKTSLLEKINNQFGSSTRFHTCSLNNLRAGELIDMFRGKGKFVGPDEGFSTIGENTCDHE